MEGNTPGLWRRAKLYPVPRARMICSFLFAAFTFLFAAFTFFVCSDHFFVCSVHFFVWSDHFFVCSIFLFQRSSFCLQHVFHLQCSLFFFAAIVFSLQRFFFSATSPLWAIVPFRWFGPPNCSTNLTWIPLNWFIRAVNFGSLQYPSSSLLGFPTYSLSLQCLVTGGDDQNTTDPLHPLSFFLTFFPFFQFLFSQYPPKV